MKGTHTNHEGPGVLLCINDEGAPLCLTKGKLYYLDTYGRIVDDMGDNTNWWDADRFKLLDEIRDEKLDKILYE
jgi:hypothetical protein